MIPDIGYVVMAERKLDQLPRVKLLLVTDGDLYVVGIPQNILLHANLMSSKAPIKPTTMYTKGTYVKATR